MKKLMRVIGSVASYELLEQRARDETSERVETAIKEFKVKWGDNINCMNLHLELKNRWPRAQFWRDDGHVLTEIDGMLFDQSGILFTRMTTTDQGFKRAFRMPKINRD